MNAAIGLCVFCEVHGPKVIFTTQTLRDFENRQPGRLPFYGPRSSLQQSSGSTRNEQRCEGCSSLGSTKYLSNDHEKRASYLSAQQSVSGEVEKLLNYACVRSLSCEVHPGKEGSCYFGDEIRGHVLSRTFTLKDAQARGFRRWCSFIVLTRDKQFLLNIWSFLIQNLGEVIKELKYFAEKKYDVEGNEFSQRAARLAMAQGNAQNSKSSKTQSSLTVITAEKHVFVRIHLWLTWILSAAAQQFVEKLPSNILDGLLNTKNSDNDAADVNALLVIPVFEEIREKSPVSVLRVLRKNLGTEQFRRILYATLTGVQILVRGPRPYTLESLYSLCFLVPKTFHRIIAMAVEYVDKNCCNFIGVDSAVAVPLPCKDVCRLDIVSTNKSDNLVDYFIRWLGTLPNKLPTLLIKIEKSLDNDKLVDSVLKMHLNVLQQEWASVAKVVSALKHQNDNQIDLIKSLGGGLQDQTLLDAWSQIN